MLRHHSWNRLLDSAQAADLARTHLPSRRTGMRSAYAALSEYARPSLRHPSRVLLRQPLSPAGVCALLGDFVARGTRPPGLNSRAAYAQWLCVLLPIMVAYVPSLPTLNSSVLRGPPLRQRLQEATLLDDVEAKTWWPAVVDTLRTGLDARLCAVLQDSTLPPLVVVYHCLMRALGLRGGDLKSGVVVQTPTNSTCWTLVLHKHKTVHIRKGPLVYHVPRAVLPPPPVGPQPACPCPWEGLGVLKPAHHWRRARLLEAAEYSDPDTLKAWTQHQGKNSVMVYLRSQPTAWRQVPPPAEGEPALPPHLHPVRGMASSPVGSIYRKACSRLATAPSSSGSS